METWRPIQSHPGYEVSDEGRVRSVDRVIQTSNGQRRCYEGKVLRLRRNKKGYMCVCLSIADKKSTPLVHRLVALAFVPNFKLLPEVNHKDTNPLNNRADNLEWMERVQNMHHYWSSSKASIQKPRYVGWKRWERST